MSDAAFFDALVAVENAWLAVLVEHGIAPASAAADLRAFVHTGDVEAVAAGAERDGNPVTGLVAMLRSRAGGRHRARGCTADLTSQDVVDTALMLCLRDALAAVDDQLAATGSGALRPGAGTPRCSDAHPHPDPARAAGHRGDEVRGLARRRARRRRHPWGRSRARGAGRRRGRDDGGGHPTERFRRRGAGVVGCAGRETRSGTGTSVAHRAVPVHPGRRCAGDVLRRLGTHRQRCVPRRPRRDRRVRRRFRRRFVDDAAQEQSRADACCCGARP